MKRILIILAAVIMGCAGTSVWASDMKVKIKVSGGGTYDYFVAGEMDGATDGFDNAYDTFYPGGSMNETYIKSYMSHPEWGSVKSEFRADMRSPAALQVWDVNVRTNLPAGTSLLISLMEGSSIPAGYVILLTDMITGQTTDIQTGQYAFVVMDNARPRTFRLTATTTSPQTTNVLTVTRIGGGTVSAVAGTIMWDNNIGTAVWPDSASVSLTAAASPGYAFDGWSGCDSTSGTVCTVTMTSARAVKATFAACKYSVTPSSMSFAQDGGEGSVTITTRAGCEWSGTSGVSWVTIGSKDSGSGSDTLTYTVSPNTTGQTRIGRITVNKRKITITQKR